ncbi:MAG: sodium:proton exchanger [Bdellovibrionaceae bacterium]|nr:sodium:proton exchanger [Pseudobdellovibrionaceae bacterium]|tara:strand:- start:6054 stop:7259 length:1206 start_codon:yes stop_codon:yes gene_type:complete
MHLIDLLALLGCALIFAKLLGGIVSRFGVPSVLAELLTGVLFGNLGGFIGTQFNILEHSDIAHSLSEMGVLFLLFIVGLETDITEITKVGKDAGLAAIAGVIAPFALAFLVIPWIIPTSTFNHTLFMGATLCATSVGITAAVLKDTGKLSSISGRIIIGAAVIDDVLGIIVLTVVSALVTQGSVSMIQLATLLGKIFLFGGGVILLRRFFLPNVLSRIRPLEVSGTITILLFSLTMIVAWTAELSGLEGIIGAFALGMALEDIHFKGYKEKGEYSLEHLMKPITDFLVPIFFVVMGMSVKLSAFASGESLSIAGILIIVAIIGKMVCGYVISKKSVAQGADRLLIGFGMIPRGEVGLIFAAMGSKLKVLNETDYAAVVAMVAVTTLIAPGLLAWRSKQVKS